MKFRCFIALLLVIPLQQTFADVASELVKAAAAGRSDAVLRYLDQGVSLESRDQKGKTALIAASQYGHTDLVKHLLRKGASIKARTTSGSTALYYAAQNHHIAVLELLHAKGAQVNIVNRHGFSPLGVAVTNRDKAVVQLLLDYGADPNTKLVGAPLLTEALTRDSNAIFQALLAKGADVNAVRDDYGETTLMIGVAMQRPDVVKLLLERGANIRAKDTSDKQVLHWLLCNTFSEGENITLLTLLLAQGADAGAPARSMVGFKDGSTPLMCAVRRDFQTSVTRLLANQVDVNHKDQDGHTALFYAVDEKNVPMVEQLLNHGADPTQEAALVQEARYTTDIGKLLLAALQPGLESKSDHCPAYVAKPIRRSQAQQPSVQRDPLKSQDYPLAEVAPLAGMPPVQEPFSLSPDGNWLVVREDHRKTPQVRSQRLVVYDLEKQQPYFFSPEADYRLAEDRWLFDSSRYVLSNRRKLMIDVTSGRPQLQTQAQPLPHTTPLFAGGDPCPWRNDAGQIVLIRPDRDDRTRVWSTDGKVVYSMQASGEDAYYLVAGHGKQIKELIRHGAKTLRERHEAQLRHAVPAEKRAEFDRLRKQMGAMPLEKLSAGQFALSPNERYLYYRLGQAGGPAFFGLPDRHLVVDLKSTPVRVWQIDSKPWGTPQWHPNGYDLYFIDQNTTAASDPAFPPMRQPARWRLSVVRFP
jgi:ankyrin repeat protein